MVELIEFNPIDCNLSDLQNEIRGWGGGREGAGRAGDRRRERSMEAGMRKEPRRRRRKG